MLTFLKFQWNWPRAIFVTYRIFVAVYIDTWLILSVLSYDRSADYNWGVWLTNWQFVLLSLHLTLSALIAVFHNFKHRAYCLKRTLLVIILTGLKQIQEFQWKVSMKILSTIIWHIQILTHFRGTSA